MNPIATPAYRPTAGSIWNSFRSSARRHLLITGGRGAGKSALLAELCPALPGLTTRAEPGKAVWLYENGTGARAQIGAFDSALPEPENWMALCAQGFLSLGVPAIARCAEGEGEWACIDEIGYLESCCPQYLAALEQLMQRKRLIAAVRKQNLPFLQALCRRDDVFLLDLDAPFGHLGCVIMASGMGVRFGGNKLMADFHGQPLVQRALAATQGIFSRRVVVTRHADVAALCTEMGVEALVHALPHRNDTVRLGLEALGDVDGCLFCPGDQPLLRRDTVCSLALCGADDRENIFRAAWGDAVGSPVLFPRWTFAQLHTLPEGKGGGYVAKKYPERVHTVPVQDAYELCDVDTPEDLIRLLRL